METGADPRAMRKIPGLAERGEPWLPSPCRAKPSLREIRSPIRIIIMVVISMPKSASIVVVKTTMIKITVLTRSILSL